MKTVVKIYDKITVAVTIAILISVSMFTLPRLLNITPYVVRSGSMEPEIPTGSVVFVDKNDKDVEVGDVITYGISTGENKGVYVTHRVYKLDNGGYIQTKGDANENPDGFLPRDSIVGTVWFHIPHVGFILDKFEQKHGYMLICMIICIMNIISILLGHLVHRKMSRHKDEENPKIRISNRTDRTK